jgi:hypothetical protein
MAIVHNPYSLWRKGNSRGACNVNDAVAISRTKVCTGVTDDLNSVYTSEVIAEIVPGT